MSATKPPVVNCPTCGKTVPWLAENHYRPFCCERCKLIDMGGWAAEQYRLPAAETPPDDDALPTQG